jgi:hypothetical protein
MESEQESEGLQNSEVQFVRKGEIHYINTDFPNAISI